MLHVSNRRPNSDRRTGQLTDSERHELLANERRRNVLAVLDRETTPVTLETVAGQVAGHETAPAMPDVDTVRSVRISLHHVHLPKMTSLGVVEYDRATRRIEA